MKKICGVAYKSFFKEDGHPYSNLMSHFIEPPSNDAKGQACFSCGATLDMDVYDAKPRDF